MVLTLSLLLVVDIDVWRDKRWLLEVIEKECQQLERIARATNLQGWLPVSPGPSSPPGLAGGRWQAGQQLQCYR